MARKKGKATKATEAEPKCEPESDPQAPEGEASGIQASFSMFLLNRELGMLEAVLRGEMNEAAKLYGGHGNLREPIFLARSFAVSATAIVAAIEELGRRLK